MNCQSCALNLNVIIALMCLIVIVYVPSAEATIRLFLAKDNKTLASFSDSVTRFGVDFPANGLMGHHIFADNPDGCTAVLPPPENGTWFAVMSHSSKCFAADKVLNAQAVGYQAAILYMNHTDELPEDIGYIVDDKIRIPSTVVGRSSVPVLLQYEKRQDVITFISERSPKYLWTLVLFGIVGIAIVLLFGSCLVWLINHCCNGDKPMGILSLWKLKKLKVHTYRAGDNFEACAICLEDYKEGEKLRILPCAHAFHCKCVDVWLTENRKTCPLCNKAADSKQKQQSHRINEREEDRTPLLAEALPPAGSASSAGSNASENLRVQRARGNICVSVAEVHEAPSVHRGRRNYGSVDSKVQDQPSPSLANSGGATENAGGSVSSLPEQAASCDSFILPAKFYIGTPRDSEESSVPRTGFAVVPGQRESASETETVDSESRIPTASTSVLSKPYCAETDKV